MRSALLVALLVSCLVLAEPAVAQGVSDGNTTTVTLTAACSSSPPTGCMSPETVRVPVGTTTVTLTFVNNASTAIRLDACVAGASGSMGGATGGNASGSYSACPTTTNGTATGGNATAGGGNMTSGGGSNMTGGGTNATGMSGSCPGGTASGSGATGTGMTNSTGGSAGGMNGTGGNATGNNATMRFPLTVPACGTAQATVTIPTGGAVGIILADRGVVIGAVTTSAATNQTGQRGNATYGGNQTLGGNVTGGANESTGVGSTPASKGTPGFGLPLGIVGVGVAALALSRRKK